MRHRKLMLMSGLLVGMSFVLGGANCQGSPALLDLSAQGYRQMGNDRSNPRQADSMRALGDVLQREAQSQRRQRERGN